MPIATRPFTTPFVEAGGVNTSVSVAGAFPNPTSTPPCQLTS